MRTAGQLRRTLLLLISLLSPGLPLVLAGCGATVAASSAPNPEKPAPAVSITAAPSSITAGSSAMLTVNVADATQVTVAGTDGSSYTMPAGGGTQPVSPAATTTYTAAATGAGGTASATATVNVAALAAPTVSISAQPQSIQAGGTATLLITAGNATGVSVTGTDGSRYTVASSGGTQTVIPESTTTYTASATGAGGVKASASTTVSVAPATPAVPTVTISATPSSITAGGSSTITVAATDALTVTLEGTDGSSYKLSAGGGMETVTPVATTTYTANVTGSGGSTSASAQVTVLSVESLPSINHVIFMLQENHTFDNYFGMLNPYRHANNYYLGDDSRDYEVDGIDPSNTNSNINNIVNVDDFNGANIQYKLFKSASTCVDDESSDWLASYGDVNRYDFTASRPINMDGFVHNGAGYAQSCSQGGGSCAGDFTDTTGKRAMAYYDQDFLNYYYYMASQFALSDRWFSPVSSKSIANRIATFTGGTTQGLVKDPGGDDHLNTQLNINNIFEELDGVTPSVSWKIYYTVTDGFCFDEDDCQSTANAAYPATDFESLSYSYNYIYENPTGAACIGTTKPSSVVGDMSNSFCIDPNHIAPLTNPDNLTTFSSFFNDLSNGTLPSFAFIEAGYGNNDEHPGSGQSILLGQAQVANILNTFMASPSWHDSVFFLGYDEGGGPYDHVPPVPGHSNDYTSLSLIPDIGQIAVNADGYEPCFGAGGTPTLHCDLAATDPQSGQSAASPALGFDAQLGFRIPNMIVSPFTRRHYVGHQPMDHTAVIKFVENRFLGPNANLTARDAAQPNLLDFFDFTRVPWATPPSNIPAPVTMESLGYDPCQPANMGP